MENREPAPAETSSPEPLQAQQISQYREWLFRARPLASLARDLREQLIQSRLRKPSAVPYNGKRYFQLSRDDLPKLMLDLVRGGFWKDSDAMLKVYEKAVEADFGREVFAMGELEERCMQRIMRDNAAALPPTGGSWQRLLSEDDALRRVDVPEWFECVAWVLDRLVLELEARIECAGRRDEKWLTIRELAMLVHRSPGHISRAARSCKIISKKVGERGVLIERRSAVTYFGRHEERRARQVDAAHHKGKSVHQP